MHWSEILGYLSAFLILFSMLFVKSQLKFHLLNSIGYICLGTFGFAFKIMPIVYFCVAFVLFDFFKLYKILNAKPKFEMLQVNMQDNVFQFYCERNKAELDEIFGKDAIADAQTAAFMFRNNDIAGILAYSVLEQGTARILVDYVSPKYRDGANGKHLYINNTTFWSSQGIERLEVYAPADSHIHYLEKMGFVQGDDPATWEKFLCQ